MIAHSMDTVKEKGTGKLFTVLISSCGSLGNSYTIGSNSSTLIHISEEELSKNFEKVSATSEYDRVWPAIRKFGENDYHVKALFDAFLRRATEGYYNIGDHVILIDLPGGLSERDRSLLYAYAHEPVVFKISDIVGLNDLYHDASVGNRLLLSRPGYKEESYHDFLEIPMYADRVIPGDAFYCVRRLDMPF